MACSRSRCRGATRQGQLRDCWAAGAQGLTVEARYGENPRGSCTLTVRLAVSFAAWVTVLVNAIGLPGVVGSIVAESFGP
jgi:hypothetical protein